MYKYKARIAAYNTAYEALTAGAVHALVLLALCTPQRVVRGRRSAMAARLAGAVAPVDAAAAAPAVADVVVIDGDAPMAAAAAGQPGVPAKDAADAGGAGSKKRPAAWPAGAPAQFGFGSREGDNIRDLFVADDDDDNKFWCRLCHGCVRNTARADQALFQHCDGIAHSKVRERSGQSPARAPVGQSPPPTHCCSPIERPSPCAGPPRVRGRKGADH